MKNSCDSKREFICTPQVEFCKKFWPSVACQFDWEKWTDHIFKTSWRWHVGSGLCQTNRKVTGRTHFVQCSESFWEGWPIYQPLQIISNLSQCEPWASFQGVNYCTVKFIKRVMQIFSFHVVADIRFPNGRNRKISTHTSLVHRILESNWTLPRLNRKFQADLLLIFSWYTNQATMVSCLVRPLIHPCPTLLGGEHLLFWRLSTG